LPLITAVATLLISTHFAIVDPIMLSAVLPDVRDLRIVTLISSAINDHELLAMLVRLIIRIVVTEISYHIW
jgi:hypothetical protein